MLATLGLATPAAALVQGIDVSRWQGFISWETLVQQNQIDFAFIKATDSSSIIDPRASRNITLATQQDVPLGVYHYATPFAVTRNDPQDFNNNDAAEEAAWFVQNAGDSMGHGHLPPVLDIEFGEAAGRTRLTDWAKIFLDTVEDLTGVRPIIYANQYWATTFLTASELDTALWIARWTNDPAVGPSNLGGWSDYLFHQYSATLNLQGINTNTTDGDTFNGTLAQLHQLVSPTVIPEPALASIALGLALLANHRTRKSA